MPKLKKPLRSYVPANPFTTTGRVLAVGCLFLLLTVFELSLAQILCFAVALVVVSLVFGFLFRPRLKVSCQLPTLPFAGQEFPLVLKVANTRGLDAFDLKMDFHERPRGFQLLDGLPRIEGLPANGAVELAVRCRATLRGMHRLPSIRVTSLFPLGTFRFFQIVGLGKQLEVAPEPLTSNGSIANTSENQMLDESAYNLSSRESILEYIGSREYQVGMNVRRWDFASWARLGKPAVREFTELAESEMQLVVDTHLDKSNPNTLEIALSIAADLLVRADESQTATALTLTEDIQIADEQQFDCQPQTCEESLRRLARVAGQRQAADWKEIFQRLLPALSPESLVVAVLQPNELKKIQSDPQLDWVQRRVSFIGQKV